jgi:predicted nucleotide-binding protein
MAISNPSRGAPRRHGELLKLGIDLSERTVESLEDQLARADFAVLILAADDVTISRDVRSPSPSDNVLFELGLFMGRLGRRHTFYLFDETAPVKLPTDLAGMTGIGYIGSDDLDTALGPACTRIRVEISRLEPSVKLDPEVLLVFERLQAM